MDKCPKCGADVVFKNPARIDFACGLGHHLDYDRPIRFCRNEKKAEPQVETPVESAAWPSSDSDLD